MNTAFFTERIRRFNRLHLIAAHDSPTDKERHQSTYRKPNAAHEQRTANVYGKADIRLSGHGIIRAGRNRFGVITVHPGNKHLSSAVIIPFGQIGISFVQKPVNLALTDQVISCAARGEVLLAVVHIDQKHGAAQITAVTHAVAVKKVARIIRRGHAVGIVGRDNRKAHVISVTQLGKLLFHGLDLLFGKKPRLIVDMLLFCFCGKGQDHAQAQKQNRNQRPVKRTLFYYPHHSRKYPPNPSRIAMGKAMPANKSASFL